VRARTLLLLLLATVAVLLSALPVTAQSAPRFGPKQYVRVVGWPQTFTETFPDCARGTRQFLSHTTTPTGYGLLLSSEPFGGLRFQSLLG
jgi:hypothetical protein